ncbi:MAG: hypothetical protein LBK18_02925 [Prevotellaceae bacterium]|nr:hypothetical protein [Prevotellaceae bacterium]
MLRMSLFQSDKPPPPRPQAERHSDARLSGQSRRDGTLLTVCFSIRRAGGDGGGIRSGLRGAGMLVEDGKRGATLFFT